MPTIPNVTCPVCGCLCDDIEVQVKNNKIVKVGNACGLSESKFLSYHEHRLTKPLIRKNGELVETSIEEAVRKSAEILADAAYPLLYGWSCTSCETLRVGLELAEEVGGVIDNSTTVCHGPSMLSIQDVGYSTCTLGQIRHRADLVIYWGSNPWSAHPRHIERYTAFTEGRFQESIWHRYPTHLDTHRTKRRLQRALNLSMREAPVPAEVKHGLPPALFRKERKMIVVDVRRTRTADISDYFLQVEPNKDYEVLEALRALIRDEEIDVDEVAGVPVETLEELADIMIGCKFGVLFFGVGLTMSSGKLRNIDTAILMVQDLNRYTKFIIMPMRGHFNVTGADVVSAWQSGYPYAVDFSRGYPRYNPGETSIVDILARDESDATLVVASDPVAHFPRTAVKNLVKNPLISIDPHPTATSLMADVVFPCAFVGIEAEGTAYRMDHVPLPLRKLVEPPKGCPSDTEILQRILVEVRKIKRERSEKG